MSIYETQSRLKITGFQQQIRVDYGDTFAPVVKVSQPRSFVIFAAEDLELHQMT